MDKLSSSVAPNWPFRIELNPSNDCISQLEWCNRHLGVRWEKWNFFFVSSDYSALGLSNWVFANEDDAIWFQLTWNQYD